MSHETIEKMLKHSGRGWVPDGKRSSYCAVHGWHSECSGAQFIGEPQPCECWCHVARRNKEQT